MHTTILRLKLIFVAVFFVGAVAIWSYQIFYVIPRDRCEAVGAWWDPATRICATPILLPKLTGRPFGSPPVGTAKGADAPALKGEAAQPLVTPGTQSTSPAP